MALVVAPFHRHKLAYRGMSQEMFSPPAPAGAGVLGRHRTQGFAKSAHPWLCSLRSCGAEQRRGPSVCSTTRRWLCSLRCSGAQHTRPDGSLGPGPPHSRIFGSQLKCTNSRRRPAGPSLRLTAIFGKPCHEVKDLTFSSSRTRMARYVTKLLIIV